MSPEQAMKSSIRGLALLVLALLFMLSVISGLAWNGVHQSYVEQSRLDILTILWIFSGVLAVITIIATLRSMFIVRRSYKNLIVIRNYFNKEDKEQ